MKQNYNFSAFIPIVLGIYLVTMANGAGYLAVILVALPALLLISGGIRSLLKPDYWAPHHVVCGALLALLLALPVGFLCSASLGYSMLAIAVVCFITGGWIQIRMHPRFDDIPAPKPTPIYSAQVALDDAVLSLMSSFAAVPNRSLLAEAVRESETAYALFKEYGWLDNPRAFHKQPPAIERVNSTPLRIRGFDCEHLAIESQFVPSQEIPGNDRWQSYAANQTSHAYILRHQKPGPWLICVHGAGMGHPKQDFKAFRVAQLHQRGINVALFTLPVHGARAPGKINGEKFFGVSVLDFVHGMSHAIWDLRRLISWIRHQQSTQIGAYGISLGAYTSALLAGIEENLDCVIAGVPTSDLIHTNEYLASALQHRLGIAAGINMTQDRAIHRVVSPLCVDPFPARQNRYMYAASADQFVPIEQVRALWLHWEKPEIQWLTGGHVLAPFQRNVHQFVESATARSFGLFPAPAGE